MVPSKNWSVLATWMGLGTDPIGLPREGEETVKTKTIVKLAVGGSILLSIIVVCSIRMLHHGPKIYRNGGLPHDTHVEEVSLINLISTPERYDGKWVSVSGFFVYEFENTALYLTPEDRKHFVYKNAVWVEPSMSSLGLDKTELGSRYSRRYCQVTGVFDKIEPDMFFQYSGTISNITHIITLVR